MLTIFRKEQLSSFSCTARTAKQWHYRRGIRQGIWLRYVRECFSIGFLACTRLDLYLQTSAKRWVSKKRATIDRYRGIEPEWISLSLRYRCFYFFVQTFLLKNNLFVGAIWYCLLFIFFFSYYCWVSVVVLLHRVRGAQQCGLYPLILLPNNQVSRSEVRVCHLYLPIYSPSCAN